MTDLAFNGSDIPRYPPSSSAPPGAGVSASDINSVAKSVAQIQAQVAAGGDVLPIIFGTVRTGAMIAGVTVYGGNLIVLALWCQGEVDAVGSIFLNDTLAITRAAVTGATNANPCVLTIPAHSLTEGQVVQLSTFAGMTQLNAAAPSIHIIDSDHVSLNGVNSTAYGVYTSGGLASAFPVSGITGTHYTGTPTQTVDPTLRAAYGASFADAMVGVCYSVFSIAPTANAGFPRLVAQIRGLKVPLTSGGTPTFTENAAYCIAALVENTTWGMGRAMDWPSVASVAAAADASIGSPAEPKRRLSLMLDTAQPAETWLQQLRDYAGAWIVPEGSTYRLVPDALPAAGSPKTITGITQAFQPSVTATAHGLAEGAIVSLAAIVGMTQLNGKVSVIHVVDANHFQLMGVNSTSYTAYTSGGTATQVEASDYSFGASNIVQDSLSWALRGAADAPTVIETTFTDRTVTPWKDNAVTVADPRVAGGTLPRRMSRIQRQGIYRASEAYRYGLERLNAAILCDMTVQFVAFDEALSLQIGDIIDVTHGAEFTAKLFRVQKIDPQAVGRWTIAALEWDPAVYSNVVVTIPSSGNTSTPNPANPPAITGLTAAEELFQTQDGYISSRIRGSWTPLSGYPPAYQYEIILDDGTNPVDYVLTNNPSYVSAAIQQGKTYTLTVYVRTSIARSPSAVFSLVAQGKLSLPGNVPFLAGYEASGEVFLNWTPAPDIDMTATELRFGPTAGSFATATVLDRVAMPSIRYSTRQVPPGTWRFYAVGLDSVRTNPLFPYGQQSPTPKTCDIVVNTNPDLYLAGDIPFGTPSLTLMSAFADGLGNTHWVSDTGGTWNSRFPSNLNTYANPLDTYQTGGTSTLLTDTVDFTLSVTGIFTFNPTYIDLAGTASLILELSTDGFAWTQYTNATTANATAQYARFRITTTGVVLITSLGNVRASVSTTKETGQVTSSAGGPVTITLANKFARLKTIQLTGQIGSDNTVRNPVYLNGVFSFDLRYVALDYCPEDYVDESYNPTNSFGVLNYNALGNPDVGVVQYLIEGVKR